MDGYDSMIYQIQTIMLCDTRDDEDTNKVIGLIFDHPLYNLFLG